MTFTHRKNITFQSNTQQEEEGGEQDTVIEIRAFFLTD